MKFLTLCRVVRPAAAFGQRVLAVPWVSRMQQLGCIYYFTRTRVLDGRGGWSGQLKRQHDANACRWYNGCIRVSAFYMPSRNSRQATSVSTGRYECWDTGWPRRWVDAGPPMTRAQPWEFAAVGLQLEMFSTVLICRPDDEMPGKHGKIARHRRLFRDEKYSSIRRRPERFNSPGWKEFPSR
mgnify:CR=1 FL=1